MPNSWVKNVYNLRIHSVNSRGYSYTDFMHRLMEYILGGEKVTYFSHLITTFSTILSTEKIVARPLFLGDLYIVSTPPTNKTTEEKLDI